MPNKLTDTFVKSRKPAKPGQRYEVKDTEHPRLHLRVTDKGHRSFVYLSRFPGSSNPTRRLIGDYPTTSLAEAREKARSWDSLLAKGVDPRVEHHRLRAAAERARMASKENTFAARAEEYLRKHCKEHRQLRETRRIIDKELAPIWGDQPLTEIASRDVKAVIAAIAERSPSMARNVLTVAKSFFDWAREQEHVEASPAASVRPKKLIGIKKPRQRLLDDREIVAVWNATWKLGYPYQHLYRFLLLTGVRLREAAEASWSEIDFDAKIWTVPSERFKSDRPHMVPLSVEAMKLLHELPRFAGGDFVFTYTGTSPINSFSKPKAKLDKLVAGALGSAAAAWTVHDFRRVLRSKLASMQVPDTIAEAVLGHGKRGLAAVYDQHKYEREMREALELWAAKLRDITEPPPENVVKLKSKKRA